MERIPFPDDLVHAQREWYATYHALAVHQLHTTPLRRRLLRLSTRIWWHPYWQTVPGDPAALAELRRTALHTAVSG